MDELIQFLRARLDEREAMLHAVGMARLGWATFLRDDGSMGYTSAVSQNGDIWACDGHVVEPASVQVVFDPKQELADVAAKREIVAMCEFLLETREVQEAVGELSDYSLGRAHAGGGVLRRLALPFADQPGYDESWRP